MESIAVISFAGAITGIIDVITRSISGLRTLQTQWKAAALIVDSVIGQLTILKAALSQISQWICTGSTTMPQHYPVILELGESLESCKRLVLFIDDQLTRLKKKEANSFLTFKNRARAVLNQGGVRDCSIYLSNQCNALNLLLTTFNW